MTCKIFMQGASVLSPVCLKRVAIFLSKSWQENVCSFYVYISLKTEVTLKDFKIQKTLLVPGRIRFYLVTAAEFQREDKNQDEKTK